MGWVRSARQWTLAVSASGTLLLVGAAASRLEEPLAGNAKAADATFSDPAGDATNGAADLTSVRVSDRASTVTFVVPVPGVPAPETQVEIHVDADRNSATGSPAGSDFALVLDTENLSRAWWRWGGSTWDHVTPSSATSGFENGVWTTSIRVSDLGGTQSFRFYVVALRFRDEAVFGSDFILVNSYTLGQQPQPPPPPPPPPSPPPANRVAITSLTKTPARPTAGESFTVSANVKRVGRVGRFSGSLSCGAQITGMRDPRWFGSVRPGRAVCRWDIPASAVGRKITGSISVGEDGPVTTRRFSARIARPTARLSNVGVTMSPTRGPEAGRQFYYSLGVSVRAGSEARGRIQTGTVSCRATIDGKALKVFEQRMRPQVGVRCGWEVPHGTGGRTLVGSVVVRSEGGSLKHSFKRRVR